VNLDQCHRDCIELPMGTHLLPSHSKPYMLRLQGGVTA
jgi:hypothetical protein